MDTKLWDAIVVGGGPGGSIASMYLKRAGLDVLMIDKATFPRDKICGDAQGRKLATILRDLGIYEEYLKIPGVQIYGIRLSSPKGVEIEMDLIDRKTGTPGFVHRRMDLDNFLFQSAKNAYQVPAMEGVNVLDIVFDDDGSISQLKCQALDKSEFSLRAKMYIGADGANSLFARKLNLSNPPEHFIVALRAYYKNVEGMNDKIELHLLPNLVPGYFWVFPLPNREANVGLGMVVKDKNERAVNLVEELKKAVAEHPLFKERFKNATLDGEIKAWSLPVASYHRKIYGPNYMLIGDAAGLIDPLSGEGVGTAAISAKHSAAVTKQAIAANEINENFLKQYDKLVWDEIGREIKADYRIQRLGSKFPFLLNRLIDKAAKNPEFRKMFEAMLPMTDGKEKIGTWGFISHLFKP